MEAAPGLRCGYQSRESSGTIRHALDRIHPSGHGAAQTHVIFFRVEYDQYSGIVKMNELRGDRGWRRALQAKFKTEPESTTLSGRALQANGAAHQLDQLLTDRRPESGTTESPRRGLVGLGKAVENPALRLMRDADAGIDYFESHGDGIFDCRNSREPHLDASCFRELDGIADQID